MVLFGSNPGACGAALSRWPARPGGGSLSGDVEFEEHVDANKVRETALPPGKLAELFPELTPSNETRSRRGAGIGIEAHG